MDGAELARQRAADLHATAVAAGRDPWRPFEFAKETAEKLGYDVEATAPGAALLNGARAKLDPANRLILYESGGSDFARAFLIAHEIGHIIRGDGEPHTHTCDIDPTRAAEASPIGVDRVVDYGPRQRREVQMDLFAREFLMPRAVARELHIQKGLSGSEIADRLGAPLDVIAQQLLDALFLPVITIHPPAASTARKPNPEQQAAIDHRGEAYLLEAGPGTGKTETLVQRVHSLLAEGVDPRRILVLTFSNKAAGEMAERIARTDPAAATSMWIGTFHAFGLDLIRRFHTELGLQRDPKLMDRTEGVELMENRLPQLGLVHYRNISDPTQVIADILSAISRAKDEVVGPPRYAELAQLMTRDAASDDDRKAAEKASEVATVYDAYEKLKFAEHRIDFGDLVFLPVELLEQRADIRTHLRAQYDHVLVDEYQDVNRSSVRLLKLLKPDGRNLWAVGDGKQSIYRFRGASSFNMVRFGSADFPDAKLQRLKINYRSAQEIVTAFSAFAGGMNLGADGGVLTPYRMPSGFDPELRTVRRALQQTPLLAATINEMREKGYAYRTQAVLSTGNEKLAEMGDSLERLGIPVLYLGNLFERPEVRDLLSFLSLLSDRRAMGLLRVGQWDEFRIQLSDVQAVIDFLRDDTRQPVSWLDDISSIPGLSEKAPDHLENLKRALAGFDRSSRAWTILATLLLDRTRRAASLAAAEGVAARAQGIAIWQLMNFLKVQPSGEAFPISHLLDRIRRLVRLSDDRDLRQLPAAAQGLDAVRLMTIHGAKGLEFDVVHVPGLNQNTLPRTPAAPACLPPTGMIEGGDGDSLALFRAGQREEQQCLFYVAMSRAKDRLFFYAPTEKTNGTSYPVSEFFTRVSPLAKKEVIAQPEGEGADPAMAIALTVDGPLRFAGHQVGLYEGCPRRFFYTHILGIGGRRTETAYMKLHDAVRIVVQKVLASPAPLGTAECEALVNDAFTAQGLAGEGYAPEFKALALGMIAYLRQSRDGLQPVNLERVSLAFGSDVVEVRPDDVVKDGAGQTRFRRISTGHQRSYETKGIVPALLILAAQQGFVGAAVELVHLGDQKTSQVALPGKKVGTARDDVTAVLAKIRSGEFPAEKSPRRCPSCPAFFVCGPAPQGDLQKKF